MGATSWHYFTPYRPDPEAALQLLRADVFARGSYLNPASSPQQYLQRKYEEAGLDGNSDVARGAIEELAIEQRYYYETGSEEDLRGVPRARRASLRRARELMNLFGQTPRRTQRKPRTIEELLEQAAECGTHSVLDITHTSDHRGDGVAFPVSGNELQRIFNSRVPTWEQIEARWESLAEGLDRWQ